MSNITANQDNVKRKPADWAAAACDSLMDRYRPSELPPEKEWHYHQGVFLHGMMQLWRLHGDDRYLIYAKQYVDDLIDEYGNFYFKRDELDAMQAGLLLFPMDSLFDDARYGIAAVKLRQLFHTLNRTSEGGFWHKDKYPYQMWLDGLYMGGVYAMKFANRFGEPELMDMALQQEKLMRFHMRDERTGLLYHAWDEKKKAPWANPSTGCSPEFWGRSLGWYGMALVDFMDELPSDHPAREELSAVIRDFAHALIRYQDAKSGLWHQVIDKGHLPDNWLETSCSSLFVYTIAKAFKHGCLSDSKSRDAAAAGYNGLVRTLKADGEGRLIVPDICIGTSAGDYTNYVTRPRSENDLHGVGAFVLACCEVQELLSN